MAKVSITRKPVHKVTNLAVTRNGNQFTANWKVPSGATNDNDNARWTRQVVSIFLKFLDTSYGSRRVSNKNIGSGDEKSVTVLANRITSVNTTSWAYNYAWTSETGPNKGRNYPRSDGKGSSGWVLKEVIFHITPINDAGWGTTAVGSYVVDFPKAPKLTPSYNKDTGLVTFGIKYEESKPTEVRAHRYSTESWGTVTVYRNGVKTTQNIDKAWSQSADYNRQYESGWASGLAPGEWIEVQLKAINLGWRGVSATTTATKVICQPAIYSVNKIDIVGDGVTSAVRIYTKKPENLTHQLVDTVQLQRLKNTTITDVSEAAASGDWSDVDGALDNSNSWALTDNYIDALPDRGNRTWYRFKTTHDNYTRYSSPVEAKVLYRSPIPDPLIADEAAYIYEMKVVYEEDIGKNGEFSGFKVAPHLQLGVGIVASGTLDSTGVELSWSDKERSWDSNSSPETMEISVADMNTTEKQVAGKTYKAWKNVYIYDLEIESSYYFKIRTFREPESGETIYQRKYSAASDTGLSYPIIIGENKAFRPRDVSLSAPHVMERSGNIPISWTYSSDFDIEEYSVYAVCSSTGRPKLVETNAAPTASATTVPAYILSASDQWVELYVLVKNKAGWSDESNRCFVEIMDKPTISVTSATPLTTNPFVFKVSVTKNYKRLLYDSDYVRIVAKLIANGIAYQRPDGAAYQENGDVIWSASVSPRDWHISYDQNFEIVEPVPWVEITVPSDLDLVDGGNYTLEVLLEADVGYVVVGGGLLGSRSGGYIMVEQYGTMKTGVVRKGLGVRWSHKAVMVSESSTVLGQKDSLSASIKAIPGNTNTKKTDKVDIYRVTPDGADLIARDVLYNTLVIDRLAPYSKTANLRYRIVSRTKDGAIEWRDIPYVLKYYPIRFDWGDGRFLEVPYNIKIDDAFAKDFETRQHLDGARPGYWNPGAEKTSSLSTQLIRLADPEQQERVRELAQYAGPVFVRTPDGNAYPADVQVRGINNSYDSLVMDVSFDATRVDMSDEFMVRDGDMKRNTYLDDSSVTQSFSFRADVGHRYVLTFKASAVDSVVFIITDTNSKKPSETKTVTKTLLPTYYSLNTENNSVGRANSDWDAMVNQVKNYTSAYGRDGKVVKKTKIVYR